MGTARAGRRRPLRLLTWQASAVATSAALAGGGLWWLYAHRAAAGLQGHAHVLVVAAVSWTLVALVTLALRRVDEVWGMTAVTAVVALCLLQGLTLPSTSLRWVTLVCLTGVPMVALMLVRRTLAAVVCTLCAASAVLICLDLPEPLVVRAYSAVTVPAVAVVPVLVVWVVLRRLEVARALATSRSLTDPLTGLANRRGMWESLPALAEAARRRGELLVLVSADADHFKAVNDEHGHQVGDEVLVALAGVLCSQSRPGDVLVRLGGEELAWFFCAAAPQDARASAERLRAAVRGEHAPGLPAVTVSIGVAAAAAAPPGELASTVDDLFARADRALYIAKADGRDRVVAAPAAAAAGS